MRIKQVTRIFAIVGFITLSLASSKMVSPVKQRLAERVQTPEGLDTESLLQMTGAEVQRPTILAQT